MRQASLQINDPELAVGVLPLVDDGEVAEQGQPLDVDAGIVGDEILPALRVGVADRTGDDPEVERVLVGPDVELAAAVVGRVLVVLLPRQDCLPLARRVVGLQVPLLVAGEAGGRVEQVLLVVRAGQVEVERRIYELANIAVQIADAKQ